jgi:hypothetical protein
MFPECFLNVLVELQLLHNAVGGTASNNKMNVILFIKMYECIAIKIK